MDIDELKKTHKLYAKHIDNWKFFQMAYEGGKDFIEEALHQHSRETRTNWKERVEEGINFNYSRAIIDLFNFYLVEKPPIRELGPLEENEQWQMFLKDADLNGTNYDEYINETQKYASVCGSVGVLINKVSTKSMTVAEEIRRGVYPYCAIYTLPNILDWKFVRDKVSGRPKLTYLKLQEDDDQYMIWTPNNWELWEIPKNTGKGARKGAELVDSGNNSLGEIPFVWMTNIKSLTNPYIGVSDIVEISRITASIIRNISNGEETLKFAGFPILLEAMEAEGEEDSNAAQNNLKPIGHRGVMEFDPEFGGDGKPSWMEPKILESIDAILKWTDRKADEIYRIAHLSGVHGQRKSNNEVASGLALRYEFQQLNSVLSKKSESLCEAELQILTYWLKWQKKSEWFNDIKVKRNKSFSIDDLSVDLENCFRTIEQIPSKTFKEEMSLTIVKKVLPDLGDTKFEQIRTEVSTAGGAGNNDNLLLDQ